MSGPPGRYVQAGITALVYRQGTEFGQHLFARGSAGEFAGRAGKPIDETLVVADGLLATRGKTGAAAARAACGDLDQWFASCLVDVADQAPGAAVRHVHLLGRGRDTVKSVDVPEEFGASVPEHLSAVAF